MEKQAISTPVHPGRKQRVTYRTVISSLRRCILVAVRDGVAGLIGCRRRSARGRGRGDRAAGTAWGCGKEALAQRCRNATCTMTYSDLHWKLEPLVTCRNVLSSRKEPLSLDPCLLFRRAASSVQSQKRTPRTAPPSLDGNLLRWEILTGSRNGTSPAMFTTIISTNEETRESTFALQKSR